MNMGRNKLRILTGILAGHCKLRAHLTNIGLEQTKTCRFCGEEDETSIHILTNCGGLVSHQLKNLGQPQIKESELPSLNPGAILKFLRDSGLEEVL